MADRYEENPKGWARRAVDRWLAAKPEERTEKLVRWLQNYDEAAGWGEEPYRWILNALPNGTAKVEAEVALAGAIADVLAKRPDEESIGKYPEQLMHNLLSLAANLHRPEALWRGLKEMYERRRLSGKFEGLDLRERLRAALIANQGDETLADLWIRMGRGAEEFLPGHALHGFYGILMLPPGDGKPSGLLGKALRAAADYLDGDIDLRRPRFLDLVKSLEAAFPRAGGWDENLIYMADEDDWPAWTRSCVDVVVRTRQGEVLLPRCLAVGIQKTFGTSSGRELWKGRVVQMRLEGKVLEFVGEFRAGFWNSMDGAPPSFQSDGFWVALFGVELDLASRRMMKGALADAALPVYVKEHAPLHPAFMPS